MAGERITARAFLMGADRVETVLRKIEKGERDPFFLLTEWQIFKNLCQGVVNNHLDKDELIFMTSNIVMKKFLELDPQMRVCR